MAPADEVVSRLRDMGAAQEVFVFSVKQKRDISEKVQATGADARLAFEPLVSSVFFVCICPACCEYRRDSDRQCMDIGYCTFQRPERRQQHD